MKQIARWEKIQVVAVVVGTGSAKRDAGIKIVVRQNARQSDNRLYRVILRSGHSGQCLFIQSEAEWRIPDDAVAQHRDLIDDLVVRRAFFLLLRHRLHGQGR
ncbi:MAG: hypothetical protein OEU59_00955 [Gammaproteobacteria bacterium]|nr:hypothetical protein [Gammaproteobacteria bacterium]